MNIIVSLYICSQQQYIKMCTVQWMVPISRWAGCASLSFCLALGRFQYLHSEWLAVGSWTFFSILSYKFPENFKVTSLFTYQGRFCVCIKHELCCFCKEKFLLFFQIFLNTGYSNKTSLVLCGRPNLLIPKLTILWSQLILMLLLPWNRLGCLDEMAQCPEKNQEWEKTPHK